MKRTKYIVLAALLALGMASCDKRNNDSRLTVDASQVTGLWVKNSNPYEYWRFRADGSGVTWDETPDPEYGTPSTTEDLSNLTYSWHITDGDVLMFDFPGAMANQDVPKYYYITEISASTMKWRDDYGLTYSLRKANAQ